MKESFRINRVQFDDFDEKTKDRIFNYHVFDVLSKYLTRPEPNMETDVFIRVTARAYDVYYGPPNDERIFEIETDVIKPAQPKRYPKSKDEILIELKMLIMTYISDLWRDFARLDKPAESENSWKHIREFIDDTFYKM